MRKLNKFLVFMLAVSLMVSLVGCGSTKNTTDNDLPTSNNTSQLRNQAVDGLPDGFPVEIPIYTGAKVIEADNFNGNNYTLLYRVTADYDEIIDYYTDAFGLDGSGAGEDETYYEGLEFGDILIKGLTIANTGDAVDVFITIQDNRQNISVEGYTGDEQDDSLGGMASDIMNYDTAEEVTLDSSYPQDAVPLPEDAKVIGCSMIPGSRSGFVDLIVPADAFDEAVSFYTEALGVTPQTSTTVVQQAAHFKGEADGIKFAVMVSHLLSEGNDTLIQITVDEK